MQNGFLLVFHFQCKNVYKETEWDVLGEAQSKRPHKLQNRAARIILNVNDDVHYTIALSALSWEPLQTERKKRKQNLCLSCFKKWVPNHSQINFGIRTYE